MGALIKFIERLDKVGVKIDLLANYPWCYMYKVNGNKVGKEDWDANYGYTIALFNAKTGIPKLMNLKKTFELIRKYR